MPVLDRYIVRELISPFCFGGALFTFFLLIDRIYHLTELVITKGVPFYLVIRYGVVAREEAYLARKFGDVYLGYKSRVRRWL